jgi:hypothetical protein
MRLLIVIATLAFTGCSSVPFLRAKTPEEIAAARDRAAQEEASDRFEDCMHSTLGSVGPFTFAGPEARLKAAQICKDVMTGTASKENEAEKAAPTQ